jgi:hypothetical protein
MSAPFSTIKVKAGHHLMERIEEICRYLEVTPAHFIEYALASELTRQEAHRVKEDIALEEIRRNILGAGQSVGLAPEQEYDDTTQCQLCLKPIPRKEGVEGPLLCEECLSLAKGARLEPPP